jgi:hypothetical protein
MVYEYIFFTKFFVIVGSPLTHSVSEKGVSFSSSKMKVMEFRTPLEGSEDQINAENGRI